MPPSVLATYSVPVDFAATKGMFLKNIQGAHRSCPLVNAIENIVTVVPVMASLLFWPLRVSSSCTVTLTSKCD